LLQNSTYSQGLIPFSENQKWGFKKGNAIIIKAEFDTVFPFDKTQKIALVGKKNEFNKSINPLTGEEEYPLDYFYITSKNKIITILPTNFPDSVFTFPQQQELSTNYLDSSSVFKILFQNNVYLMSKQGMQLTDGYDNIYPYNHTSFFVLEKYTLVDGETIRIQGLVNSIGKTIISCKYKHITLNEEDSSIYCCSAVYNNRLNDDVYDYSGKLIYVNKKHIEFSSKKTHVYKIYEPNDIYVIENDNSKSNFRIGGEKFKYINNNKAIIKHGEDLFLIDLLSGKKTKVDKALYLFNLYSKLDF
jgi:hypothetical protein